MNIIMKTIRSLLAKCIKDIDDGSCNLSEREMTEALTALQKYSRKDEPLSKYQAYKYMNMSRATFDNNVRNGTIPEGKKLQGFKEKVWYKKDLDKFINWHKNNYECKKSQ